MKRLVRPSICTSMRCGEPPQPHCRDCSHAIYKGTATLNRTTYRWEHNPRSNAGTTVNSARRKAARL